VETLATWFGLKDGHKDFFIANDADSRLLFARQELDSQLTAILRKSFRTSNPPKFVLYGDWGVGKTHTMHHIAYVVEQTHAFKARVVFVELPDVNAKDTFQVAHAALLDALGASTVKAWMTHFLTRHQSEALHIIQRATQSEDVAKAFMQLPTYGDAALLSWAWLRGVPLSSHDARTAGLPTSLQQSNQFAAVLRMLGRLCTEIEDQLLIFMLDEATKLKNVTQGDAINHWLNSFKILADDLNKEVGLIISASIAEVDDMPDMLADRQIITRFGEKHYINLRRFGPDETEAFIRGLLSEWTDTSKASSIRESFSAESDGENISSGSYPFTDPALDLFIELALRNGNISTPRDIQKNLDDIANRAIDDQRHIISSGYMNALLAAF
jgi:Cdc6-like AAA superfamily ATPase